MSITTSGFCCKIASIWPAVSELRVLRFVLLDVVASVPEVVVLASTDAADIDEEDDSCACEMLHDAAINSMRTRHVLRHFIGRISDKDVMILGSCWAKAHSLPDMRNDLAVHSFAA